MTLSSVAGSPQANHHEHFDLVIAGGGLIGTSLALAAAPHCGRIALIEQQQAQPQQPASFDERVLALSHATLYWLQQWGLWQAERVDACNIEHIHVSDRGHFGKARLHAQDMHLQQFGAVASARSLGEMLLPQLQQASNIELIQPDQIEATHTSSSAPSGTRFIKLKSGRKLSTPLLVVAEGGLSHSRELLQLPVIEKDYGHTAVIATVQTCQPHQQWAFERFTSQGPMALLPMTDDRRSLVWTLPPARAEQVAAMPEPEFLANLQQDFGFRAGRFTRASKALCYPLHLRYMRESIAPHALVLGNAAHAMHPIAGQGFNLGMRDIAAVVHLLQHAQPLLGGHDWLKHYQQLRDNDQQQLIHATDLLSHLFSNDAPLLALGRNMGLHAVGSCRTLQQKVARIGMGLAHPLGGAHHIQHKDAGS